VFRAYDASRERLVAVKLFKLDLPPEKVHKLVAELERIVDAKLDHPALAAPLGVGMVGVSAYLAQDYVAADSLDQVVREYGPAPAGEALRVAAQIAGAMDFAGVADIAHGSMHPRDVLLSSDETRLTGIGIAHALEQVGIVPPVRRPYTAPERVAGGPWDRRADIFSLASLMHELLWGKRPSGTGARAAEALTELEGGNLDALRATFTRALADDPADRFETALQFAEALSAAFPDVTLARNPQSAVRNPQLIEPRLPLEVEPDEEATEIAPAPIVAAPVVAAAEEERYRDVEVAPAIPDEMEEPPAALIPQSAISPPSAIRSPQFETALERTRSAVWPLVLALGIGLAVGFAGGYGVGTHGRPDATPVAATSSPATASPEPKPADMTPPPVQPPAPPAATPAPTKEFTENAVAAAPRPAITTQSPSNTPQSTLSGRLLVRSTPAGARVVVDGKDAGRTPATVRELGRGAHHVKLSRDGYAPVERRVVITAANPSQSLTVPLERAAATRTAQAVVRTPPPPAASGNFFGGLVVDSRPDGARVFVDGKLAGTTPLSLKDLRAGEHAIRLEREGYRRWSSSVRVVASEQNRVTASLER